MDAQDHAEHRDHSHQDAAHQDAAHHDAAHHDAAHHDAAHHDAAHHDAAHHDAAHHDAAHHDAAHHDAQDDTHPDRTPAADPVRRRVLAGAGVAALTGVLLSASPALPLQRQAAGAAGAGATVPAPTARSAAGPSTSPTARPTAAAPTGPTVPGTPPVAAAPPTTGTTSPAGADATAGSDQDTAADQNPAEDPTPEATSTPGTAPARNGAEDRDTAAAGPADPSPTTDPAATATPAAEVDLLHLLRRTTYGPTPDSFAQATAVGASAWLDAQLDPASLPDPVGDRVDAAHPGLFLSTAQARVHYDDEFWVMTHELVRWRVARSVWSSRQLHEVMTDLMHNHLNVPIGPDGPSGYALHRYHHDVVRAHALGSFTDMLVASAEHPAMLHYLNASTSTKKSPNENYARELLELHTVGVGRHTEADVKATALLLTGWRTRWPWESGGEPYTAWFDPSRHHVGSLTVLGRTYPNTAADGRATIRAFLTDLARHPDTARHVCRRLAVHLVADQPPEDLVDDLAEVYLDSGTRLDAVLRALLTSTAFDQARGTKVRRPLERYLATVRLLAPAPTSDAHLAHDGLTWLLPSQRPLSWSAPDGYPDVAAEWASAGVALSGLNTASELVKGWVPVTGKQFTDAVLATPARDVDAITDEVARRLLLRPAQPNELDAARLLLARSTVPAGPWSSGSWNRYRAVWYVTTLLLAHPSLLDR
ncbi:DUF1800 family protein [Jannaschia sp. R86511]|uniref:DUF1800 domain-containing protein n=1 Tax=Jannaschia sp. R86511 TaxID=3093853 RepID=UPI0036D41381